MVLVQVFCASTFAQTLTNDQKPPLPPFPAVKSPVAVFRELLAMNTAERSQFLASRPPEVQQRLRDKVAEYQALSADERELRLRVTELRWYLLPLMSQPATNRPAQLSSVPAELRALIEERLTSWDALPAENQTELLQNERLLRTLVEFGSTTPLRQSQILTNMTAMEKQEFTEGIQRWQQLGERKQREITERFEQYFTLRDTEKTRVLSSISEQERAQIEKTLRTFESLDRNKRAQCLRGLNKFCLLNPAERQQFLKNAARWEAMQPAQREAWRRLVYNVSKMPALPPGAGQPGLPPQPPPPRPPTLPLSHAMATNQ